MRRFYLDHPLAIGDDAELDADLAQRLHKVLRLRPGERIILINGSQHEFEAEILALSARAGTARVLSRQAALAEPGVRVTLYQSLIRENRFELVLEKATELGVAAIVPLASRRSVVRADERSARRQRWQRILVEAAEQCGRAGPPTLGEPVDLETAFAKAEGALILPWEEERACSLSEALQDLPAETAAVSLFIGPEGGFEAAEVETARASGAQIVSLGRRILRSETAAIAAVSLVMQSLGELG
ncbi:MAG TPA: 16S rRNA (uracil(1498)-N(3))-methyltransferase [Dehalococcoidia bacterium]|nr:16S rRNA (uracil(1498)-N(3))-methyltransferase [Dehalococcoidia bacterium]